MCAPNTFLWLLEGRRRSLLALWRFGIIVATQSNLVSGMDVEFGS